jgi:uncharacterized protein (TIGR03435 family)
MPLRFMIAVIALAALTVKSQGLEFEVASVKPEQLSEGQASFRNTPMAGLVGFRGGPGSRDPGQINYTAASLKMLLARAYDMSRYQILGPSWLDAEYYSIVAKVPAGTTREQLGPMLQRLLNERFRIKSHYESRSMKVYTLTVAQGGPKLAPAEPAPSEPAPTLTGQGSYEARAALERMLKAGEVRARERALDEGSGPSFHLSFPGVTLTEFARQLSLNLNEPVIDQTRIEGKYRFDLDWISEERMVYTGEPMYIPASPALLSAMKKQLGLNLEPGKGLVQVLVVDKAEKIPTEN